jgi:shikimate kinase
MSTDSGSSELLRQRGIWAIFLVGFMGAGKTTIGLAVAKLLGWRFVDLDAQVEARAGLSIAEIFRSKGEAEFRRIELASLKQMIESHDIREAVVALGGGAYAEVNVRGLIAQTGQITVFLDAPVSELLKRCRQSEVERPLASDEARFRDLYEQRRSAYEQSDIRVSTLRHSPAKTAKTVLAEVIAAGRKKDEGAVS